MPLSTTIRQQAKNAWVITLEGSLDSGTAQGFGERIQPLLNTAGATLVVDMAGLEYISSAGLREIFKAQKAQKAAQGKMVFMHLKPQIQKVFEIVNALPFMRIFSNLQEMDDYLDAMQKKVIQEGTSDD